MQCMDMIEVSHTDKQAKFMLVCNSIFGICIFKCAELINVMCVNAESEYKRC